MGIMPRRLPDEYFRSSAQDVEQPSPCKPTPAPAAKPRTQKPQLRQTQRPRLVMQREGMGMRWFAGGMLALFLLGVAIGAVGHRTIPEPGRDMVTATPEVTVSSQDSSEGVVPYDGPTQVVSPSKIRGTCDSGTGHDVPEHLLDDDPTTIWRCAGAGIGASLSFEFDEDIRLVGMRLVNGNTAGEGRFVEERRITSVRWDLPDSSWVMQSFAANDPNPQEIRIPAVDIDGPLTLTVATSTLAGDPAASYDAISISSVEFLAVP